MTTTQPNDADTNTSSLDDIFGSSPPRKESTTSDDSLPQPGGQSFTAAHEPSDLPSLRRQHVTAGYRDGVSTSKGQHVQRGFDAGFPVGAQLGMRAGTTLGILEGVVRGLEGKSTSAGVKRPTPTTTRGGSMTTGGEGKMEEEVRVEEEELRRVRKEQIRLLYERALRELDVRLVFAGAETEDTTSTTTVSPSKTEGRDEKGERAELQLAQKGDAVISSWEEKVAVPRWEKNMDALEEKDALDDKGNGKGAVEKQS